ncbi:MAG: CvpA family protein [Clostridia bacterium]|nr:CvpA family protein [Clostridia bacterium]
MTNFLFDLVLAIILVLHVLIYALRGFFRSLWRLVSGVLSLFLSYCFGGIAGEHLIKPLLDGVITDEKLLTLASKICGYLAVFLVSSVALFVLGLFIDKAKDSLNLKKLDAALGAVMGLFIGLIAVFVICLAVSVIVELNLSGFLGEKIAALRGLADDSYVFRFFCQISPFDYINISKLVGEGIDKAKTLITAAESIADGIVPGT